MESRRFAVLLSAVALSLLAGRQAYAHYCSNVWTGPARFVVKAEKSAVYVPSGGSAKLRVYLQNNFPHRLFAVRMQGLATGYTVSTVPSSGQDIQPAQNVSYVLTITGPTANLTVGTTLNLQVQFRVGTYGLSNPVVNQYPSQSSLVTGIGNGTAQQAQSAWAAILADRYPSATLAAGEPFFGRTGIQQLIEWFGYRFCYNSLGAWRCSGQNCPSPCAEGTPWTATDQFPEDCMRAGVELGVRKAALGSNLAAAQNGAINALNGGGSPNHKCLAAVVGAYLVQGDSTSAFTTALNNTTNPVSQICKDAAMRILGSGASSSCTSGAFYEQAACAAAEGLMGNDTVVKNVLMPNAGDGQSSDPPDWTMSHFYAYMLYLVTGQRRATTGVVSYYPDAGGALADAPPPPPPDTLRWPDKPKLPADTRPPTDKPKLPLDKPIAKKDTRSPDHAIVVADNGQKVAIDFELPPPGSETGGTDDAMGAVPEAGRSNNLDKLTGGCGCVMAADHAGGGALLLMAGLLALALVLACSRSRKR